MRSVAWRAQRAPLLLLLAALACARAITVPHSGQNSLVRPRLSVTATPLDEGPADETLLSVRRSMQRVRALRRQTKVQAMRLARSSRAAAEAVYAEAAVHEKALADLEDIQRQLMRSAKAGMLRERRQAERRFQRWQILSRSGRDNI